MVRMEDKALLQQKLQDLVRLRAQVVDQISRAHGTLLAELKTMLEGIDVEIAELNRQIGD